MEIILATNLDRFKKDLERLLRDGVLLEAALLKEISGDENMLRQFGKLSEEDSENILKALPDFRTKYQQWYSESLALLRQILPDRLNNFVSLYEKPNNRKDLHAGNYVIQDYIQRITVTRGTETIVGFNAAIPQFRQQLAILGAAKTRFESTLFEIRQLVQADLFDGEIDAARELHKHKFFRAAGAVAGVVLEKHLHQVCEDHKIKIIKKNPGIGDLNELLNKEGVIEVPQWRHISLLADLRNLCDHNKQKEPSADQVKDLIDGTEKILKTIA